MFPPDVQAVIDDCLPLCRALGQGRYAVSVGGSYGKGTFDRRSDIDFRLFCDSLLEPPAARAAARAALEAAIRRWDERGYKIDGCWVRTVGDIDRQLDAGLAGTATPDDRVWTIWSYQLLTDINNQAVIEDPFGIIAGWKARLRAYPAPLKDALLKKHLASVRYWRHDYHYRSKVERGDVVFLAGLTSRLVHDLIAILFALNETYYVGDGNNLDFIARFQHVPVGFAETVSRILYPAPGADVFERQYADLARLIDAVVALAEHVAGPH